MIRVPHFTVLYPDGAPLQLSDFLGQVVIVNFWATWCEPCRQEMPLLQRTYDAHDQEGLAVLGVNVGDLSNAVQAYVQSLGVSFPIGLDSDRPGIAALSGVWIAYFGLHRSRGTNSGHGARSGGAQRVGAGFGRPAGSEPRILNAAALRLMVERYPIPAQPWRVQEEIRRSRFITTVAPSPSVDRRAMLSPG